MTIIVEENVLCEDLVAFDEDFQTYSQKIKPFKAGKIWTFSRARRVNEHQTDSKKSVDMENFFFMCKFFKEIILV